jgi:PAS domain S-box-containing protein
VQHVGDKLHRVKSNGIKTEYKVCFVSILLGLAAGLVDAVLDYRLFHEGSFWELLILDVPTNEIYSRCLVLLSFTLFGLLFAFVLAKHRRAEETLREREAHFRSVVQTASDAIISADSQGNIVFWNRAAETLFGYSADEAVHQPLTIIMPKRFHEAHQAGWQRFVATEKPIIVGATVEVVGQRKGGSEFPIELSLATWKTGEETFFTAIIRDVSERKQIEAQQEAARRLLQDTIDGVTEPVMVIGTDYQVKLMNLAVGKNYPVGTDTEPVYCYQVSHNRDKPCSGTEHPCPLQQVRETLCPATIIHEHVQKTGEKRLVEILIAPLLGEDGTLAGIVESARDITERMQTEQALRESEQRYKTLYAENRELAEGLRRQFVQRGEVLRSLITAQEDERKRVARELHDELGQALSGLALQVGAMEQLIISDPDCAIRQLSDICTLISATTDQMYDIILALRPSALDELGLAVAVHTYANRRLTGTGIAFELDCAKLTGRLPPELEISL